MAKKEDLKKDPFYEREKEKYPNPIPSREFITEYLDELGRPASTRQLILAFGLESDENKEAMRRRLRAMERDGQLISNRRGKYALVDKLDLVRGRVVGRRDGFGFVIPDDGSDDVFLSSYQMRSVFPDDVVLARISGIDTRGRREGAIVEVLERNTRHTVGRIFEEKGIVFVEPHKRDTQQIVIIPAEERAGARQGQLVVAEILTQPTLRLQATGRVIEVLGDHMAPGLETEVAIRSYELPYQWSQEVQQEISAIHNEVGEADRVGRKDLRQLSFVTIDGEDAKDFDDAVYCEKLKTGWKLYVAIADVSYYVKPNTALDIEAKLRGNSVYFPSRVIPMLPEKLSNGICSLKPQVDRLCMVGEMIISESGVLKDSLFYEAVIKSHARLTYTEVASMLQTEKTVYRNLLPYIEELYSLFKKLHSQREKRGALDFDTVETRIIFGKERKIEKIVPLQRNEAHKLIEECMLIANVAAAQFLEQHELPLLYRVHKGPDYEKLEKLRDFLHGLGLRLTGGNNPTTKDYAGLLNRIEGRPDRHLVQMVLLRSLKQAIYSPANEGHFGLAYGAYCHFTSPIRRYPDVLVHRAIRHAVKKGTPEKFHYDGSVMVHLGQHCSTTERRADQATRDVIDWLKCEFMLDKLGEEFEGVISEVTGFGVFIELREIYVEGLLHVTGLKNDYYHFDPKGHCLVGKRSGVTYRLGDKISVQVVRVDLDNRQIDFALPMVKQKLQKKKVKKKKEKVKKKKRKN